MRSNDFQAFKRQNRRQYISVGSYLNDCIGLYSGILGLFIGGKEWPFSLLFSLWFPFLALVCFSVNIGLLTWAVKSHEGSSSVGIIISWVLTGFVGILFLIDILIFLVQAL